MSQVLTLTNYKGYYATLAALETAIPTGQENEWAIVEDGSAVYIWNVDDAEWATGSGGGTGSALTNAHIFVGNASNQAADVAMSGDVTIANTGATTIANNAVTTAKILDANVTLAKIANASANSKLLGAGAAGSGAAYTEITLGTNLTMTGTTLSANDTSIAFNELTSGTNTTAAMVVGTGGSLATSGSGTIAATTSTTATALANGRTIAITGDLTYTSPSFDGSTNVTAAGTLATVNSNVGTFGSATESSVVTVNAKGLVTAASNTPVTPAVGSITGLGTGVATALAVNVGSAGAPVVNGGALGTPSSGVATNLTGTAAGLTAGTVTTNANLTGAITSSGNATSLGSFTSAALLAALTDETGTGAAVFANTPTLVTPILGVATGTSFNGITGIAAQSDQETATSTVLVVTPGRQQYHPSANKAWVNFNGTGTVAIRSSYNVSSITDNGTGDYTINFTTAFSGVDAYCGVVTCGEGGNAGTDLVARSPVATPTTGAWRVKTLNAAQTVQVDVPYISAVFSGDQ